MAQQQKNEFNQEDKKRNEDITSKSGQAATQVNKTQEMHSEQGKGPGLRNLKNEEENLNREKKDDDEDDEIVGERESQEESRVKNFKDTESEARR